MEAWSQLPDPSRIQLDIYGNVSFINVLEEKAEECGITGLYNIHGFVDEETLERALQDAHFALNLRWPTMGETSSSQLRYWSHALPTIASDVGWYHEVPEQALIKIPIENEVECLREKLLQIVGNPASFAAYGEMGREYLEKEHSPQRYVDGLLEFARERAVALKKEVLDDVLVSTLDSMCEDFQTLNLFQQPIETAVALFEDQTALD